MVALLPPYMARWGAHREEDRGNDMKKKLSPLEIAYRKAKARMDDRRYAKYILTGKLWS